MENIKYLQSGEEVVLLEKTQSGYLIDRIWSDGITEEEFVVDSPEFVQLVFDSPPVEKYSDQIAILTEQIKDLKETKRGLENQIEAIRDQEKDRFKRYAQCEQLRLLDEFIAGKITHVAKETKGTSGFKVSVMVDWSVYNVEREKVIYELTTGGYSDSQRPGKFKDELVLSLKDAVVGLLASENFIKYANKMGSSIVGICFTNEFAILKRHFAIYKNIIIQKKNTSICNRLCSRKFN